MEEGIGMDAWQAIETRRTIRRYRQQPIPQEMVVRIVNAGRLAASAGNAQPIRFVVVNEPSLLAEVFSTLAWLRAAGDPPEGQRPTAYVVVLGDTAISASYQSDAAAACQNMQTAAWAEGIGSCWIGSVNRPKLKGLLGLPDNLEIYAVISLGYPAETAVAEDDPETTSARRRADGVLRVPKRPLAQVLRFNKWG